MQSWMRQVVVTLVTLAALSACHGQEIAPPIHTGERVEPVPSSTCPFGFHGARVAIERTPLGADVVLEAYGDPSTLRRRARDSAAMYGPGAHRGMGHGGAHGNGQRHGLGLATLGVPVRASEEDTSEGATIHVVADDPAARVRVRQMLVERANAARSSDCR